MICLFLFEHDFISAFKLFFYGNNRRRGSDSDDFACSRKEMGKKEAEAREVWIFFFVITYA